MSNAENTITSPTPIVRPTKTIAPYSVVVKRADCWELIDDCHNLATAKSIKDRAEKNAKGRPITVRVYDNKTHQFILHPSFG